MSITKAEILASVNSRLSASYTAAQIATNLLMIMHDLSSDVPGMLQTTGAVTVAASGFSVALPTDLVRLRSVYDASGKAIERMASLDVLNNYRNASADAGTVSKFFASTDTLYVYPKATASTILTVLYDYEDDNIDSIQLPEHARLALIEGVCWQMQLDRGVLAEAIPEKAVTHFSFYQQLKQSLQVRYGNN